MVDNKQSVTTMVLKVDLQCWRCYKKVKKILCKFPQIQDQVYDEKQNTVTIRVVCCSPEKIKRKIICKGGESIKSIDVKVPEKPNPNKENPDKQGKSSKPQGDGKPNASDLPKPKKDQPDQKTRCPPDSKGKPENVPPSSGPTLVPEYQPPTCCRECYEGRGGGPCFYGCQGRGLPPCYQYDGYLGRPVYDSYGGGRSACYLICEEDSGQVCRIM
ncbi:hypothetical protein L484_010601 [Morus notabilis]|uniref:HMA domain-containing protein n=1 Tax=Morus notabilis TaxID=981085 RepID=W9QNK5_9ROSA|nr:protein PYRICULARIA ORYZAE RESISTANCE 21 [Morus notabilis]EXB29543.1 hypothetical protein L484_010601 [Morus notabilis]